MVKLVAFTPPKLTAVAPVKFVPVIVTTVPLAALVGVKDVIVEIIVGVIKAFLCIVTAPKP